MKLETGISIEQKQTQTISMTPELIQAVGILQLNTQELDEFIDTQLEQNPLLERTAQTAEDQSPAAISGGADAGTDVGAGAEAAEMPEDVRAPEVKGDSDFDWNEYLRQREYDDVSYAGMMKPRGSTGEPELDYLDTIGKETETLADALTAQLITSGLSKSRMEIGRFVIEVLDEHGYLPYSPLQIAKATGHGIEKTMEVIEKIRTFEPAGVCAYDLRDCLILQINAADNAAEAPEDVIENARKIVSEYLDAVASGKLTKIAKWLELPASDVQRAVDFIRTLDPRPGYKFSDDTTRYIVPDLIMEKDAEGELSVRLNDTNLPHLTVSPYYREVLAHAPKDSDEAKFLTERLNAANWVIKSIEHRSSTIYNVMWAIASLQSDFFRLGAAHLHPLTLRQVAERIGVHESTVSRCISGKYVQTPRGVFELKYFFASGVASADSEGVASGGVKSLIKEIIDAEDKAHPVSDQQIADELGGRGIDISRRTVAKYRENMGIASSPGRKRY
jgi:RNA polymerase sigma-54 factor